MTAHRAVFVGAATEDTIAVVDSYPEADERVLASAMVFGGGGPAATAAVACATLGVPSALVAAVGDDEQGQRVRERLHERGVDTSGVITIPGATTSHSVVVISQGQGTRAIVNRLGPALDITGSAVALKLLAAASWVHVDQMGWAAVRAVASSVTDGMRLSIDAGNDIDGLTLDRTALYAPTRASITRRYRTADLDTAMSRALAEGAELVVVTDGGRGAVARDASGWSALATPPEVDVVSTLGAGDVFHGALIAGLVHAGEGILNGGIEAAVAYATTAAAWSCRGVDGRSRIPSHAEVMTALASAGGTILTHREMPR
jgi:sulfofructose kinase